ncbi:phosphate permease [Sulfodiicoccus acidiphilus]|uniref:Phosphate permease n=1 Tax=Sulfodiicoccus acidiphilus TaxID=1670455 RepID=A0A348B6Q2_9CREN|nr:inorganic phosphate transporter [Sulfodiicoccus acidiphilus]BBD73854.1 phosphate permease [Sulfodiicoccus acidiphilus]
MLLESLIFALGAIASFFVGGNNISPSLGILVSTNVVKRKAAYFLAALSIFLGASVGGLTMSKSVRGIIEGKEGYTTFIILSVLLSCTAAFFYLNRIGVPSSLTQMLYPSLAVLSLLSREYVYFDWRAFFIALILWILTPGIAIGTVLGLYLWMRRAIHSEARLLRQLRLYKVLILGAGLLNAFVLGANAIGLLASAGSFSTPIYVTLPSYGMAAALGVYVASKKGVLTMGFRLTRLGYLGGVSAVIGSSAVAEVLTLFGIPISVTQTMVGGIIGLGFRGLDRTSRDRS